MRRGVGGVRISVTASQFNWSEFSENNEKKCEIIELSQNSKPLLENYKNDAIGGRSPQHFI